MAKKDRDEPGSSEDAPRRRTAQFTADLKTEDAAAYLEALARALRNNHLVVQTANETLDVRIASRLSLDLEARSSRDAKKSSIEFRLDWSEPKDVPSLSISSGSTSDDEDMETVASASTSYYGQASEEATEQLAQAVEEAREAAPETQSAPIWTSGAE